MSSTIPSTSKLMLNSVVQLKTTFQPTKPHKQYSRDKYNLYVLSHKWRKFYILVRPYRYFKLYINKSSLCLTSLLLCIHVFTLVNTRSCNLFIVRLENKQVIVFFGMQELLLERITSPGLWDTSPRLRWASVYQLGWFEAVGQRLPWWPARLSLVCRHFRVILPCTRRKSARCSSGCRLPFLRWAAMLIGITPKEERNGRRHLRRGFPPRDLMSS